MSLSREEKRTLLAIARRTVEALVRGEVVPPCTEDLPILDEKRGCFVTLKTNGRLRGCIGTFQPDAPLRETLPAMAKAALLEDPRFAGNRISPEELPQLVIEISLLSPLRRTDDPLSIELGVHGIYIRKGFHAGCFLPQVATETGWSKEEFLSYCASHKAGLPPDAWKDPDTEVYTFTAEVFSEEEFEHCDGKPYNRE